MDWQFIVATLVVLACLGYAAWSLMPAALRSRLRRALGRPGLPEAGCGSGCDGCGDTAAPPPGSTRAEQVIRVFRRPPGGA